MEININWYLKYSINNIINWSSKHIKLWYSISRTNDNNTGCPWEGEIYYWAVRPREGLEMGQGGNETYEIL